MALAEPGGQRGKHIKSRINLLLIFHEYLQDMQRRFPRRTIAQLSFLIQFRLKKELFLVFQWQENTSECRQRGSMTMLKRSDRGKCSIEEQRTKRLKLD